MKQEGMKVAICGMLSACLIVTTGFANLAVNTQSETQKIVTLLDDNRGSGEIIKALPEKTTETTKEAAKEMRVKAEKTAEKAVEEARKREEAARKKAAEEAARKKKEAALAKDRALLAAIIFCEAGGEPYEGKVAVGAVIMNRVRSGRFPNTISGVIYQRGQFGPVVTGKLGRVIAAGKTTSACYKAADAALSGENPIGSRLYFGNGNSGYRIGGHYFH